MAVLVLALSGASATTNAQAPSFPRPDEAPRGIVLDESSQPIAGARVALVASTDPHRPFAKSIAQVLRKTPLPEMRSQRDGTFILPLTAEQRRLGAAGEGQFWLVVAKEGYHDWREPLFAGLPGYLGSRVILRKVRPGDPYATLPWPPTSERMLHSWTAVPKRSSTLDADRRGANAKKPGSGKGSVEAANTRRRPITLRLVDGNGQPLQDASLLFGNSSYGPGSTELPTRTGTGGSIRAILAFGRHDVRIAAPGSKTRTVHLSVDADTPATQTFALESVDLVDILAVDVNGRPVPFTRMNIVAKDLGDSGRLPHVARSDSAGRIRIPLVDREAYFAYSHFGLPSKRIDLAVPDDEPRRVTRVPQFRAVTVIIRGDDLPAKGTIRWKGPDGEVFCGFGSDAGKSGEVVTRVYSRDNAAAWIGGESAPPVVIRATDLPPAPRDPLLDLAVVDRKLRKRAEIVLGSSSGTAVRGFAIRPEWQAEGRWDDAELMGFDRRKGGKGWAIFVKDNKGWSLWARDDGAYELIAKARGHEQAVVSVPARDPAAELPKITVTLRKK